MWEFRFKTWQFFCIEIYFAKWKATKVCSCYLHMSEHCCRVAMSNIDQNEVHSFVLEYILTLQISGKIYHALIMFKQGKYLIFCQNLLFLILPIESSQADAPDPSPERLIVSHLDKRLPFGKGNPCSMFMVLCYSWCSINITRQDTNA